MGVLGTSSYRWIILLLATLVQVGVSILQQAPAALGQVLTRDLELSRAQIGILSSAIWGGMLLATTGYAFVLMGVQGSSASYLILSLHEEVHLSVVAAGLVGILGAASIVGRILLGGVADRAGPLRAYRVSFLLIGASFALWWAGDDLWLLAAFAAVLGVGYGGFVALSPVVLSELFGVDRLGSLLGVLLTANGAGSALGPPFMGLAVDATGSYTPAVAVLTLLGLAAYAALLPLGRHVDVPARANHH